MLIHINSCAKCPAKSGPALWVCSLVIEPGRKLWMNRKIGYKKDNPEIPSWCPLRALEVKYNSYLCHICGRPIQAVRSGKWQCDCEVGTKVLAKELGLQRLKDNQEEAKIASGAKAVASAFRKRLRDEYRKEKDGS